MTVCVILLYLSDMACESQTAGTYCYCPAPPGGSGGRSAVGYKYCTVLVVRNGQGGRMRLGGVRSVSQ